MQIMSTYSDDVIAFGVDDEDEGRQTNYIEEKIQEEEFQEEGEEDILQKKNNNILKKNCKQL